MNRLPVKALYLHVPFCARKCYYCDFNTYVARPEVWERFVQALVREIRALGRLYPDTVLETVYAGGGTPSLLSCRQWQQIFEALRGSFHLASDAEISLEANPGTVDREKLQVLRELGVNRLSIGAQSFNRELLRKLGRSHGPEEIVHSVELARSVGGFSLNLDLMFGIPGQTMEDWRQSLAAAVGLGPDHLSAYGLKVEEGTPYSRWYDQGVLDLPSEDLEAKMYTALMEFMDKAGYEQYEISNFARPGARCRHNLVYWSNEPYLAAGPGAHGYVDGVRYVVVRNVPVYMELAWEGSSTVEERHEVSDEEEMEDTMILGLRLLEGVGDDRFAQRHGRSLFDVFSEPVERYLRSGLLVQEGSRVRLAREALWISNEVLQSFLALSIDKV
ncbi:MAG: radical SAM family heme chaperone HemW [Kyrpidia tusciae]|nr:radical SAM family heme chaperone HemW [Kyrpidia tusciae]MBE3552864.1 radical SAM family heme chaperone HemW [Kyrpidia tusciae]